jgi:hypothetical protein
MTQYDDRVEAQRQKTEAEEWGKGMKYIHANDGVIETAFNNGDIKYETRIVMGEKTTYKITWHREKIKKESLIEAWGRWLVDRNGST